MDSSTDVDKRVAFYCEHYELLRHWLLRPGDKVCLGDEKNRVCRFCGESPPQATFKKTAHAIPEALGNKSIESAYECDKCNEGFGQSIENDLGNWSKPTRTFARIRGKNGVPTLKKGGPQGWRIEYEPSGFQITAYEHEPVFDMDEENKRVTFHLKRDPFVPVAVLKAFVKIGLTLLPDEEMQNFRHAMDWVRSVDHSASPVHGLPIIYSFLPGPMPNDLISVFILKRKAHITDYPYSYMVLGYGNEVFQVQIPSVPHDHKLNHATFNILPFPTPDSPDPELYGKAKIAVLDLTGRQVVRGQMVNLTCGFHALNR